VRVAVVGAGFAGLACATDLALTGIDVTVYEARERVGGRVWSDVMPDGAVFERGGEFIEAGYDHMLRRAAEHGLAVTPQGFDFADREVRDGRSVLPTLLMAAEEQLAATVEGLGDGAGRLSAAEALERTALDPLARRALERRLAGTFTVPLAEVAASWLARAEARAVDGGTALPSSRLAAGNDALATSLAAALGERVRLACAVEALQVERDGVECVATCGRRRYDRAVLAVPLPLLRSGLLPALAGRPSYARLRWGEAAKLHAPLARPAEPAAVQGLEAAFWSWTAAPPGGGRATFASSFAGGRAAGEALEIAFGGERWLAALRELRPELALGGDAVLTSWRDDRWAQGSYSCQPPGWSRADDAEVAEPHGRVHLAGEHTAGAFCGTMEGALRSGARAAAEILAAREHA
jgi:monoamine oxidase